MEELAAMLIPVSVCVVLPICIVWIIFKATTNNDNRRAEVLLKALETDKSIDADKIAEAFAKPKKSAREVLNARLLRACICALIGLVLLVVSIVQITTFNQPIERHKEVVILGGVLMAIGISYFIVYFVSRKDVKDHTDNNITPAQD